MSHLPKPTRVRLVERVGFGLYVLVAVVLVGRQVSGSILGALTSPSPAIASTARPTAVPSATAPGASPAPSATVSAVPSQSPRPTAAPIVVSAYQYGARRYAAIVMPVGETLTSPIAGTASVVVYQFLGGEIRVGSNIPSEPFFPYITITSSDARVVIRPAALDQDVQLTVRNGEAVAVGSPLLVTRSAAASSWRTFYDRGVTAQVIASASSWPSGVELDPVPLFRR